MDKFGDRNIFVVYTGKNPDIYEIWDEFLEQVDHFPVVKYDIFQTYAQAETAWFKHLNRVALQNIYESRKREGWCGGDKVVRTGNNFL